MNISPGNEIFFKNTIWCDSNNIWICITGSFPPIPFEGKKGNENTWVEKQLRVLPLVLQLNEPVPRVSPFAYLCNGDDLALFPVTQPRWEAHMEPQ